MDIKNFVEHIMPLASPDEQVKYKVLSNSRVEAYKQCQSRPGAASLRSMQAVEQAEQEYRAQLVEKYGAGKTSSPVRFVATTKKSDVFRWLTDSGYAIKKSTFYNHCNQGKLHKNTDGQYTQRLINQYLKAVGLYRGAAGAGDVTGGVGSLDDGGLSIPVEDLPARKLLAEVKKLQEQYARERLKRKKEEGSLIPRADFNREMAARAVVLDAALNYLIQAGAPEFVAVVGGDPVKIPELVRMLTDKKDALLAEYVRADHLVDVVG